jgi:hypothetical protein
VRSFLRRHRHTLLTVAGALAMYIGSYLVVSRRGMAEMQSYGMTAFFYVPADKVFKSPEWEEAHYFLMRVYEPLNYIDCALGAGKSPCHGFTRGLSRPLRG